MAHSNHSNAMTAISSCQVIPLDIYTFARPGPGWTGLVFVGRKKVKTGGNQACLLEAISLYLKGSRKQEKALPIANPGLMVLNVIQCETGVFFLY